MKDVLNVFCRIFFRRLLIGLAASAQLLSVSSVAQEVELETWRETEQSPAQVLTELLAHTQSLQATVEQLTLDQQGRGVDEAIVELKVQKPDHFYWHVQSPYEQLLVTDGMTLWIYEPDLDQVTIDTFDSRYSRTPAMLLSASADTLAEAFIVEMQELLDERTRFVLFPLEQDSLFVTLSLTFHRENLEDMQFENTLGQRTSMHFSELQVNVEFDESDFTFTAPEGVPNIEVLDNRFPLLGGDEG